MKTFFWKDKTGRGHTNTFDLDDLFFIEMENIWDDGPLFEWAQDAEEGDVWENASDYYICTKS